MSPASLLAERRRAAAQLEIARTAVRLIAARGFDGVTVESIAESAGISARTFYRYFPAKEDVVVPLIRNGVAAVAEQLARRPASEPLTVALPAAFTVAMSAPGTLPPREAAAFTRILAAHPAMRGRWLDTYHESEYALAQVIASRLGLRADAGEARLAAVAAMSALRIAVERWAEAAAGDSAGASSSASAGARDIAGSSAFGSGSNITTDDARAALVAEALRFFADGAMLHAVPAPVPVSR
ncbi:MAG: TetR family transcriptional regulator [Actinocrinis sp.]